MDVSAQLAALQRQLENLAAAEGSLPQLQQERARMSICLRTIKVGGGKPTGARVHEAVHCFASRQGILTTAKELT